MNATIQSRLNTIEDFKGVRILFAIESGSRAWGFHSHDSDWDVRFVYVSHKNDYLTVFPRRDVIENSDLALEPWQSNPLLDFSGWDLRKWFALTSKSNPTAFEWLASPLIYRQRPYWLSVRQAMTAFYSPKAAMHHYVSMAKHNFREHMRDGQSPKVRLKKYLYITRPLLCARWIQREGKPAPMAYDDLLNAGLLTGTESAVLPHLRDLAARKRAAEELEEGCAIPEINEWITAELPRAKAAADNAPEGNGRPEELDELFRYAFEVFAPVDGSL